MLVIELRFPAGRYHATPWGRHVNEGAAEWPPSPFRLSRALVDVWARRRPHWGRERIGPVLAALAGAPSFALPPATFSHTRAFLSLNSKDANKKTLVFDAFAAVDRTESVRIGFAASVDEQTREDLAELLGELNYLGRSESWVSARLMGDDERTVWNCRPSASADGSPGEAVDVACLRPADDYERLPYLPRKKLSARDRKKGETPPPLDWFDAICLSTAELQKDGWSAPPALFPVPYVCLSNADSAARARRKPPPPSYREAHYALAATVLPRVTETVAVAEQVRTKLMGIHRRIMGAEDLVSTRFSGKHRDGSRRRGHQHIFVLPMDTDGDGYLDRIVVRLSEPFTQDELAAIDGLRSLWQRRGRPDIQLMLTALRDEAGAVAARRWTSATPYVTRRHYRKRRGPYNDWIASEIRRECGLRGLPEPKILGPTKAPPARGRTTPWYEFLRSRKEEKPLHGYGCSLVFDEEVRGPIALGALCHYGLGVFVPTDEP